MSAVEALRDAGAVLAAVGLVAALDPIPRLPGRPGPRRAAGVVAALAGAFLMLGTLTPGHAIADRLRSPQGALAALVGLAVLLALAVVGVRQVLRRPLIWFALLALALPFRVPIALGGEDASLLVPLYAVIGLGLLAWLLGRLRGTIAAEEDPHTPLDLPLAAFLAFLLVSTLWSADTHEAGVKAIFFYVPFTLLYLLVVAWWPRAKAAAGALALVTVGLALPVAALALVQYASRDIFWNRTLQQANVYSRFFRVNGIFYDPNILGRFLVVALLATLALAALRSARRELAALAGCGALMAAGLMVTFSRSSALMLIVGLAMLAAWTFGLRRTATTVGAALALALAVAVVTNGPVREALTSGDRLEKVSEGRFDLVRGGLTIWREAPIEGAGLGGFQTRFTETLTPTQQARTRVLISHNAPITVLSEGGIIGFGLFAALLIAAALAIGRGNRALGPAGFLRWTALAALTGIVIHSLLYSALFEDPYTWVLAGAAVALGLPRPGAAPAPAPEASTRPVPVP
jgi:O-antigen ligase